MQFQDQVKVPIHLIPRGSKDFLQLIHHSAARQYMVEMLSYPHVIVLGAIAGLVRLLQVVDGSKNLCHRPKIHLLGT